MPNYTVYHLHTMYSLLDSATSFEDYVDMAKSYGMTAIGCSEHGNVFSWYKKKEYAEKNGLKFLYGIECYLTETFNEKIRDNYHTILIAKNKKGMVEINNLFFNSTDKNHKYYKPRLLFDEFLNISDNVIKISACVQSPLNKYMLKIKPSHTKEQKDKLIALLKHYDYYEIQYHNADWQIEYNKYLYTMSKRFHKPLIVGTDTHSLNNYKAECRTILQYGKSDGAWGDEENDCDLTFKSYDELVEMFKIQNSLPMDVVLDAIENTNIMADSVENITFNTDSKYPLLYGDDDEKVLWNRLKEKYDSKIARNEISDVDGRYKSAIKEEMAVFKKINMIGFMLFMSEIMTWARDNGIATGFARGSCAGSTVAYIADITDVDPIKWNTVFSRFANENRVEEGDIDVDFYEDDRPKIYDYIINRFGTQKTAYILAVGTLADKSVIDTIGKALSIKFGLKLGLKYDLVKNNPDNPYNLKNVEKIKKEWDENKDATRKKYSELFYYYDGLVGCVVSQSQHPAGILVSCVNIIDEVGAFYGNEGQIIAPLDMDECHELGLVKFDILGLKSVGVIDKAFKMIGKRFPRACNVDWNDQDVFKDISNDSTGIFQFESPFAKESIKKMQPTSVDDLSLCSACLRPSGESYREQVFNHEIHKNPSPLIDEVLSDSNGFLVYQEQTIAFLQKICGLSGSEADTMRRNIAKKKEDKVSAMLPIVIDGYCNKSDKPREESENEVKDFIQVIQDASGYQFGFNHSESYSMLSYVMGWLRYHYPTEFCTAYLNCAKNDEDLYNGTLIAKQKGCSIVKPKFRYSLSEYGCNPETHEIFKGLTSIKDISKNTGDNLYKLRDNQYNNFVELLKDIKQNKYCDSGELTILISIGFFEEFGNPNQLLKVVEIYNKFINAKQPSKDKLTQREMQVVHKYAKKETPKQFKDLDNLSIIYTLVDEIEDTTSTLEQISYDLKYLGYTTLTYNCNYFGIEAIEVNKYGTPYIKLYRIATGESDVYKIDKKWYNQFTTEYNGTLEQGDILDITLQEKPKRRKVDDEWVEVGTELVIIAFCRK